ncbi:MAG: hypothetical protein FWH32_08040 [Clostridiales bacterium]|nr:hypothetical protein [Clostridiales bacterium]
MKAFAKGNRAYGLAAWVLTLVLAFTMIPAGAAFAEPTDTDDGGECGLYGALDFGAGRPEDHSTICRCSTLGDRDNLSEAESGWFRNANLGSGYGSDPQGPDRRIAPLNGDILDGDGGLLAPLVEPTATFNIQTGVYTDGSTHAANNTSWASPVLTVNNGANIAITGTPSYNGRIEVAASATATITLDGVTIASL